MGCCSMGGILLCLTLMVLSPDSINVLTVLARIYKLSLIYHCENVHLYKPTYLKQQTRV